MRVLITGSHGFVGRNFVRQLLKEGHDLVAVDSLISGGGGLHHSLWTDFSLGQRNNFQPQIVDVRRYFEEHNKESFDLVIHLAAVVGGRATIEQDPLVIAEDLSIDAAFWRWARAARPGHIVSFSSSAAYPVALQTSEKSHLLEESDLDFSATLGTPDLTYGWAKLTHEYLGTIASDKYGLKVATYRPFSGYGNDQDSSYPFRAICERALQRVTDTEGRFFVWGSGNQKRDFVHIEDIVSFVMQSYPRMTDGRGVNISTGILTSFKELASLACREVGWTPEIVGLNSAPEGVFSRGGDTRRQRELGFTPQVSLSEGVSRCISYLKDEHVL